MPVKINRGRRTERVKFGGLGRQRRREERCHQQADDSMRQVIKDKGDEDVIGVVAFHSRVRRGERRPGFGAHGVAAVIGGQRLGSCLGCGLLIAGVFRVEPGVDPLLLLYMDGVEFLLKRL